MALKTSLKTPLKTPLKTTMSAPSGELYAIALDVGTTTLAASLVETSSGRIIASASLPNPQKRWGNDVIARIEAVIKKPALLENLRRSVVASLNGMMSGLLYRGRVRKKELKEISIAGNSVMEHIVLGISPGPMGRAPSRPAFKEAKRIAARDAGFNTLPQTLLYLFPLIGGFVGGDAVAVVLSTGMAGKKGNSLAIDIGTNSEIILSTKRGLFTTSAAAGPAFEGGEIKFGMAAERGAISGVMLEGDGVRLDVIGSVIPKGICGSGIVDAACLLLKTGVMEKTGRLRDKGEVPTNLAGRIKRERGGNSFILFKGPSSEITLSQKDVRAFQVAKAAIRAGVEVLFKRAGTQSEEVERVYIAGAFGSNLKKESLAGVGVVDEGWLDRVQSVGDAVLAGARLALLHEDYKKEAEGIARAAKYVPLSGSREFEREFIKRMNFH